MFFSLLIGGGSIPLRTGNMSTGVDLMHPVISLMHSFRLASNLLQCTLPLQTGEQYSATEKHRARADDLKVEKSAPHLWAVSLFKRLHLAYVLAAVLWIWLLYVRDQSRVTPRYFGFGSKGILSPLIDMLSS